MYTFKKSTQRASRSSGIDAQAKRDVTWQAFQTLFSELQPAFAAMDSASGFDLIPQTATAMGFLLPISKTLLCALSRQGAGAGAGWCLCCWVLGANGGCWLLGASAVSWLRVWWRHGAGVGAGCRCCRALGGSESSVGRFALEISGA